MDATTWLGWISSLVLLFALAAQVSKQWESRSIRGVSGWLYAGQVLAEMGFVAYSALLRNYVFLFTNSALLLLNLVGLMLYWKRQRESRATR